MLRAREGPPPAKSLQMQVWRCRLAANRLHMQPDEGPGGRDMSDLPPLDRAVLQEGVRAPLCRRRERPAPAHSRSRA